VPAAARAPVRAAEDAPNEVSSDSGSAAQGTSERSTLIGTPVSFDGGGALATVRPCSATCLCCRTVRSTTRRCS
jgi:hypothetical protein